MELINSFDPNQIQLFAYEEVITQNNDSRFMDAFVNTLNLKIVALKWNMVKIIDLLTIQNIF